MRILLISQWYSPEPRKLISELALSLQGMGHSVTVVTGFPNWPSGKLYPGYKIKLWQKEVIDGIPVVRVPLYPDHSRRPLLRFLNFFSFAASAALLGPLLVERPDVIHAIQPIPAGLSAVMLGWFWGVPVTMEVQDLWPETLQATGFVSNRNILGVVRRINTWVLKKSARVRVISNGFRDALIRGGISRDRIDVISNWADSQPHEPVNQSSTTRCLARLTVLYAGSIGPAQDLDTVVEAARLLQDSPDIEFVIAGEGIDRERLQGKTRELGLTNISFLGWLPEAKIQPLLASADVLLLHLRDDPLFRITIPHKVYVYLATGRPVLAAVSGESAEVVRDANAGLTCPPGDPIQLAETVRCFAAMGALEREGYGQRGREAACDQYSRSQLTRKLEHVLQDVVECAI
jgi:colanic acid biosynthesis glycosyl transferase WcaI